MKITSKKIIHAELDEEELVALQNLLGGCGIYGEVWNKSSRRGQDKARFEELCGAMYNKLFEVRR